MSGGNAGGAACIAVTATFGPCRNGVIPNRAFPAWSARPLPSGDPPEVNDTTAPEAAPLSHTARPHLYNLETKARGGNCACDTGDALTVTARALGVVGLVSPGTVWNATRRCPAWSVPTTGIQSRPPAAIPLATTTGDGSSVCTNTVTPGEHPSTTIESIHSEIGPTTEGIPRAMVVSSLW